MDADRSGHGRHPLRAGIVGCACNNSRMPGSTSSTFEPRSGRSYFGGPLDANASLTVFFEIPSTRAITLIGNLSAQCSRRISAQSATDNIPFWSTWLG